MATAQLSATVAKLSRAARLLFGYCLIYVLAPVWGAAGSNLRFERLSLEHGLSQSTVNAIVQDHQGFLWFGTQDGLNRYDGYSFVVFRSDPDDSTSLSNNVVRSLLLDRAGTLWIGTDGGLSAYDRTRGSFKRYRHDAADDGSLGHDFAWVLHEDAAGMLWVGTDGGGLDRFDRETETFTHFRHDAEDPGSLSNNEVRALLEDTGGRLWIGTDGGGLDRLDRDRNVVTHYRHDPDDASSLSHDEITTVFEDQSGVLWVGTDGRGLDRFDRASETFTHFRHDPDDSRSLGHDEIRGLFQDSTGTLWVGTDAGGLSRVDAASGTFTRYLNRSNDSSSLSNNFVRSIYEDRSGVLWIGTDAGGLNKLDRQKNTFAHYRHDPLDANSLGNNLVFSILQDRSGVLWIGTWGGLHRFDREQGVITRYRHQPGHPNSLANDEVWPIHEDRAGDLWIGTFGGLDRLDRERETFTHYRHDPKIRGSLSHDYVRSIYEDELGTLWVGTDGGLNRFDRQSETFSAYRHDPDEAGGLSHDDVRVIVGDREGVLWLGTAGGGVNAFDPNRETFAHYRHEPANPGSLSHDFIRSIYEDRQGRLWIGTDDGLNQLDRSRHSCTIYRTSDGLPNNVIYGILEDDSGSLWLSTNGGLSKLDPRTGVFKNYDASDGLQNNEFNTGAYHRSADGELFFGGINGLNAFFPAAIADNSQPPPVVLTAFRKFNETVDLARPIETAEAIELSYRDDFFSLEFAALDYRSPEKNLYAYKLEGFDDRWIESGTKREATYTNLDPGRYLFRVRGSNNDGVWNDDGPAIRIIIHPPFWGTWWFRGATLFAAGLALLGAHKTLLLRSQRRQHEAAERARATEREVLIRELEAKNEELERFTYSVAHDLKAPLLTIQGFLGYLRRDAAAGDEGRLNRDVERITAAAGQMHHLVEDLLELSRVGRQTNLPEKVPFDDLVQQAQELVAGEIRDRTVDVRIAPDLPVVMVDRARLVTALQNLLQNAVKYMDDEAAPRVTIGVRHDDDVTVFYVRDNGVGIEPEYHHKIFELFQRLDTNTEGTGIGLALVKRIIDAHGGCLWVESQGAGHGSTFCFTLPSGSP